MMQYRPLMLALLAGLTLSGVAQAALHDRGGGLIYDDVLDVTWLQDANLIASNSFGLTYGANLGPYPIASSYTDSAIYSNGLATWQGAMHWVDAMNDANYFGFNDWRLPKVANPNSGFGGTTGNELAHLFYETLGNSGWLDGNCSVNCLQNTGPFTNVQDIRYWYGSLYSNGYAWIFEVASGYQGLYGAGVNSVWAVRSGDVSAPVPEPGTYALMLAGLGLVGWATQRR